MKRIVSSPHDLHAAAIDELKGWLGVTVTHDDLALRAVLQAALDMFEQFTGLVPLKATYQEYLAPQRGWQCLLTRPVHAMTQIEGHDDAGMISPVPSSDYAMDICPDGSGKISLLNPEIGMRYSVMVDAGLAPEWADLPHSIRHGLIRLAAHFWREREADGPAKNDALPPLAVAALWRPWRRMRLL